MPLHGAPLLEEPRRHVREKRAESFRHGGMSEDGVAQAMYGRPSSIAICTAATTSPASAPIIVKPRMWSSRAATSPFIKLRLSSIVCVRSAALIGSFATRASIP
jgi:hypothetical protein